MTVRGMMILRDVLYAVLVVILLLPSNPIGVASTLRVVLIVLAIGTRVWQHVNYYKQTGKIY
ncbi:MAG: hypothetical protein JWQ34_3494 [Mucilaginibacter sp.]|jgi:hypothetical protein|uniref:hypothetical protein n=1 Tax=Mucilaginibacter sp. TaxID=1882438 RepID=UPI0026303129|nr:hypothetical protein [Mucilaginibacter sp.]MDB5005269.1 hypothetical protein [Mucilaginibacter sp.]